MRFLHTADWHLGRLFHQIHLTEDQSKVLRQFLDIVKESKVDAVVIAGDVYDRAVPPPEAVSLLDETLSELLLGLEIPTILVAGNHDSPERLAFASRLLACQGLHVFGLPENDLRPVRLGDEHGPVDFYAAPYSEPALIRERLGNNDVIDHEGALRALLTSMMTSHPLEHRSVFVGHAYVAGGSVSESERPLSVGGAGVVNGSNFRAFNYTALGHLHRPQTVADANIRYAGALLKYSFDEVGQQRTVTVVEMDSRGGCRTEEIALTPVRDLRVVEGTMEELLQRRPTRGHREDFVLARLHDKDLVLDAIGKLRSIYPNITAVERTVVDVPGDSGGPTTAGKLSYADLFASFFKEVTGEPPTRAEASVFATAVTTLSNSEREVRA